MIVTVKPRQQTEIWSLYWRESLDTKTTILPDISLLIDEAEVTQTLSHLTSLAAKTLGWQPVEKLSRLPGFTAPFDRVLQRGRELDLATEIGKLELDLSQPLVFVRTMLKADGWSIKLKDDPFASDSEDED
jgi:hypothetical protein